MTICYFGLFDPEYSRNHIMIRGLEENGVSVTLCRTSAKGPWKYLDLIRKHWQIRKKYDIMIVGFPGFQAAILARLLTSKPLIYDAFYSIHDSLVKDRKVIGPRGFKAQYYRLLDWLSCRLADIILLDTDAQIDYFIQEYELPRKKFARIFVGSDDKLIYPLPAEKKGYFLVHFHGSFIPLQGVEFIVEAAKILESENIRFNIIGRGQTYGKVTSLARAIGAANINFIDPVPFQELNKYLAQADVVLGIFGRTEKAGRVIPNKVYEGLAAKRPVLTGDSPAIRELLADGESAVFCRLADGQDLAEKIMELKSGKIDGNAIADRGYGIFLSKLRPQILVKNFLDSKIFRDLMSLKGRYAKN